MYEDIICESRENKRKMFERSVSQIAVFVLYFVRVGLLQECPKITSGYHQQLYYCCESQISLPPPLYVESDQEIFWYMTEHLCGCVCMFMGGGEREREREVSNSVACFYIMLILAHTDSNNRHMLEVTRHPSCQSA